MCKIRILLFSLALFLFCLLFLRLCNAFETVRETHLDWESLMDRPDLQRGWYTALFADNITLQNNIHNITVYWFIDSLTVWGKFRYTNDFINYLPLQINHFSKEHIIPKRQRRLMQRIGFRERNIEFYFYEIQERHNTKWVWYYFIDTNENVIYFFLRR